MKKTTSILSTALLSTFASCALAGQVTGSTHDINKKSE